MPASPAVILANIPPFLRTNGKVTATHVLGSKTGVEVGVCYWKLHPTQPRFMVVFKNKVDRDNWYNTSMKLQEMKMKGVLVSTAWYSRDIDQVISEEEGQALDSGGRGKKSGGVNYMKLLQERDKNARGQSVRDGVLKPKKEGAGKKMFNPKSDSKTTNRSVDNMSALSAEIEDLSMISTSQFIFSQKNKLEKLVNSPLSSRQPPPTADLAKGFISKKSKPVVTAPSYNLRSSQVVPKSPPAPLVIISQDFSVPPPPLRLPLHVLVDVAANSSKQVDGHKVHYNSNILAKLEECVLESLEDDKENKINGDVKHISKTVANSWKANIESLEKIYETVLSDASPNVSELSDELAKEYHWKGDLGITREQALGWTKEFLVKAGMRAGSDMEERFAMFLAKNSMLFKISINEIKFIMQRNGLDINSICKAFSENSSSIGFRNFVKTSVSISGHLLDDFAGVFLQFFKSKMDKQNSKSSRSQTKTFLKPSTGTTGNKMNGKGDFREVKLEGKVDTLNELIAKNDVKGIKQVVNEVAPRMKKLASLNEVLEVKVNDLMNARNKLESEVKLNKGEYHEKIRTANQENKILRVRNTTLLDELRTSKEENAEAITKSAGLSNFIHKFSEAVCKGDSSVGELLELSTTEENDKNVCKLKEALEKFVGKKVSCIKVKKGKEQGFIYPTANVGGDGVHSAVAQDEEVGEHLGQGCISTPGHSRRQESNVGLGPMFPPHLGGPRISTE